MVNVPAILSASNFPSCPIQSRAPSPRRVSSSLRKFLSPAAVPHSTSVVSLRVREGRRQGLNVEGQACHGAKVWAGCKRAENSTFGSTYRVPSLSSSSSDPLKSKSYSAAPLIIVDQSPYIPQRSVSRKRERKLSQTHLDTPNLSDAPADPSS